MVIRADEMGKKKLVTVTDGDREYEISWKELLLELKLGELEISFDLAIEEGDLGFRKALLQVFPLTRKQRCWMHKSYTVPTYFLANLQGKTKVGLQNISMVPLYIEAIKEIDIFIEPYSAKYLKTTDCFAKNQSALLVFYDFLAEQGVHLCTINLIKLCLLSFVSVQIKLRVIYQGRHALQGYSSLQDHLRRIGEK